MRLGSFFGSAPGSALLGLAALAVLAVLVSPGSPYLGWDYGDPEAAVLGVGLLTTGREANPCSRP